MLKAILLTKARFVAEPYTAVNAPNQGTVLIVETNRVPVGISKPISEPPGARTRTQGPLRFQGGCGT